MADSAFDYSSIPPLGAPPSLLGEEEEEEFDYSTIAPLGATHSGIGVTLEATKSITPQAATDTELTARSTGMPPDMVRGNEDALNTDLEAAGIVDDVENSPRTRAMLEDFNTSPLMRDDTPSLTTIEGIVNEAILPLGDLLINAGLGLGEAIPELAGTALQVPEALSSAIGDPVFEALGFDPVPSDTDPLHNLGTMLKDVDFGFEEGPSIDDVIEDPASNLFPFIVTTGIQSMPEMMAAIFASPVYLPTLATRIAQDRAENDGRDKPNALDMSMGSAAAPIIMALERIGGKSMLGLTDKLAGVGFKDLTKAVGTATLKEGITEAPQEALEEFAGTLGTERGASLEGTLKAALGGFLVGAPIGGGMRVVTAAIEQQAFVDQADVYHDKLIRVLDAGENSNVRARSGELFQEMFDELAAESDLETVNVNVWGVNAALESAGTPEQTVELFQQMGITEVELNKAMTTGGDVTLKTSTFLEAIRDSENRDIALLNVRNGDTALTVAEADVVRTEGAAALEKQIQDIIESNEIAEEDLQQASEIDAITDDLAKNIEQNLGHTAPIAQAEAKVITSGVRAEGLSRAAQGIEKPWEFEGIEALKNLNVQRAEFQSGDAELQHAAQQFDTTPEILKAELDAAGGDITQTPRFKEWFQNSAVVDESGTAMPMFHGSAEPGGIKAFDPARIRAVDYDAPFNGFWFTADGRNASPAMRDASTVTPVYISMQNPAGAKEWRSIVRQVRTEFDEKGQEALRPQARSTDDEVRFRLQEAGFDGIFFEAPKKVDREALDRDGEWSGIDVMGRTFTLKKSQEPELSRQPVQRTHVQHTITEPDGTVHEAWRLDGTHIFEMLDKYNVPKEDEAVAFGSLVLLKNTLLDEDIAKSKVDIQTPEGPIIFERIETPVTVEELVPTGSQIDLIDLYSPSIGYETSYGSVDEFEQMHNETVTVVFEPTQIKSVFNRGTFDPEDPRILYQSRFDELMDMQEDFESLLDADEHARIMEKFIEAKQWRDRMAADRATFPAGSAAWTDERLDAAIEGVMHFPEQDMTIDMHDIDDNPTSQVVFVDPLDFIIATSENPEGIEIETGPLNREALAADEQTPILQIANGEIIGHQGRHRLMALAREGVVSVPVILDTGEAITQAHQPSQVLGKQVFRQGGQVFEALADIEVVNMFRLDEGNRQAIKDAMAQNEAAVLFQEDQVREIETDPLDTEGAWQQATVEATNDNNEPVQLPAGEMMKIINRREEEANRLLDCINAG
ncbi:hypothetical protein OAF54_00790 [bacterium]|nr:hypothetical protein [bacterium]